MKITLFSSSLTATQGELLDLSDLDTNLFEFLQKPHAKTKSNLPQFSPCIFEDDSRARGKIRIELSLNYFLIKDAFFHIFQVFDIKNRNILNIHVIKSNSLTHCVKK